VNAPPDTAANAAADVAIVIVSTNEGHWLERCLPTVYAHAGSAKLQVIVVDNSSTDGTAEIVRRGFPAAEVVGSENRGFAHGNNRGIEHARARYVLLLNPDTEILQGTFGELVQLLDATPRIGLAGVRQQTADGTPWPTIRRFPSVSRAFGDALFSERWPLKAGQVGERVIDPDAYERMTECDWTSGSFMLIRREALLAAGLLDERFFIYSEEPDLCLRIKSAGWSVFHLPQMTIVHHAGKGGIRPRMTAQDAYARKQYARKYFSASRRGLYLGALAARHAIRGASSIARTEDASHRREAARRALMTLRGSAEPPFGEPPATAVGGYRDEARRTGA
jgi:GT2 family glycosyltransferase